MKTEEYLSTKDVAQLLGVSIISVRNMVAAGKFPQPDRVVLTKINRRVSWKKETVERFLSKN